MLRSACLSVCLSVRERISGTTRPTVNIFMHATYDRGSVPLWRRCDTLCTSGFMDDVMRHNPSISLQQVTSLRRRSAAPLLCRVPGDGGRRCASGASRRGPIPQFTTITVMYGADVGGANVLHSRCIHTSIVVVAVTYFYDADH